MPENSRMTQTLNVTEARQQFNQLLNRVFRKETRIVVEKSGIPVAAIISADDLEQFSRWETQRQEAFETLDRTRAVFAEVPDEELEVEVSRAIAETRRGRRQATLPENERGDKVG